MDRKIEKKKWPLDKVIIILLICAFIIFLGYLFLFKSGKSRLKVDPQRMTSSKVTQGEFLEYIPIDGVVTPLTTVFLDIEEGGRVEEIFAEGGQPIMKGDLILRFSNATLQRNSIDTETRLLENLDNLRNTQFNRAQSKLMLQDTLLDLNYRILGLERRYKRYKALKDEDIAISEEDFETVEDELKYYIGKRDLLKERIKQEDLLSEKQLEQANKSIERLNMSLDLLGKTVESLEVRAPISGHLSSINAEIGQTISRGQRIGQIDQLDFFKVRANIDQYYITKVALEQKGNFNLDDRQYELEIIKIYPEVTNDTFEVDMKFVGTVPDGVKRGQTLQINLSLSNPEKCMMLRKGGFYQETGGRWVYLISEDRKTAYRTEIRIGRQNPQNLELLEGLNEGDWIITSGYGSFNKVDELQFTQPIQLTQ